MPSDPTYGIIKFIKTEKWNGGLQGWRNERVKELLPNYCLKSFNFFKMKGVLEMDGGNVAQ